MNRSDRRRSTIVSLAASGVACLVLCGCAVDQKKEVATYRAVIDGKTPQPYEYHAGEPLTMEAALLLANRNDEQLASGGEDYLQALIDKERQFSQFLPVISLAPAYTWLDHRSSSISASAKQGSTDVPINGQYNVFNGFQDVANYRRSGYTASQRKALLLDLQQTILLNLVQTYYSVLTNERSVTVLLNSAQLQNARVQDMQSRQRAGLARPLDVAQSEAQAAATRVQLIQAQNNVRTSRIALAFLTSAPVQDAPLDDHLHVPDKFPSQDELTLKAQTTRQDVQAGEAAVEAARQNVQAAIGQYYPSVTLNLENFLHKESLSTLTVWEGVLEANIPIFTAGQIDANVRTAWSQLRQAWLNDQRTHRLVSEQVRTAYENLEGSRLRLHDLHIEVAAARDALQQARFSYTAGLATNLDVLTAIDQVNSAELSLASEQLNFKVFFMQLQRSQGLIGRPDSPLAPPGAPSSQPSEDELTSVPKGNNPQTAPAQQGGPGAVNSAGPGGPGVVNPAGPGGPGVVNPAGPGGPGAVNPAGPGGPGTSGGAGAPNSPAAPSAPGSSNAPGAVNTPAAPGATAAPSSPSVPTAPASPAGPPASGSPVAPNTAGSPAVPGAATAPTTPPTTQPTTQPATAASNPAAVIPTTQPAVAPLKLPAEVPATQPAVAPVSPSSVPATDAQPSGAPLNK